MGADTQLVSVQDIAGNGGGGPCNDEGGSAHVGTRSDSGIGVGRNTYCGRRAMGAAQETARVAVEGDRGGDTGGSAGGSAVDRRRSMDGT